MHATASCFLLLSLLVAVQSSSFNRLRRFRGHNFHLQWMTLDEEVRPAPEYPSVQEYYLDSAIQDHFAPLYNRKYWRQRYFVNEEFWGGQDYSVFLYIGGEGPLSERVLTNHSYSYILAKEHKALLVALEHRYYGKSYPTYDMSIENLRFLSSKQALADIAHFHSFIQSRYGLPDNAKWVGFGGSYPGNLAAWVKLKYPSLFAGTVASSAPIRAEVDFKEYMEVVGDSLRYFGGGKCYHRVEQSVKAVQKLLDGGREERKMLSNMFKPCYPMTNGFDESVFTSSIMGAFQGITQYNGLHENTTTLDEVCDHFSDMSKTPLELLASLMEEENDGPCIDSKFEGEANATIDVLRQDQFDGKSSMRQWLFQSCNEFGYFQTTTSAHSPFASFRSITEQNAGAEICRRVFNIQQDPDTKGTNIEYGGHGITVENVTFPSGTIDPWHALAVQNSTYMHTASAKPVYIEGTAHCADMYGPKGSDSPSIQWAHQQIAKSVAYYLSDATPTYSTFALE